MADGNDSLPPDPNVALFVVQHELQRSVPVTQDLVRQAQDLGYDLLTAPITTSHFQSRVLSCLQEYVSSLGADSIPSGTPLPLISPLLPPDTDLTPDSVNSSLVAVTSPWIDLSSADPLIAHVSRQVFSLEVAYASFCGISNVLVHGPVSSEGTMQFARAIQEALGVSPFLQLHIILPMLGDLDETPEGHLAELARTNFTEDLPEEDDEEDQYKTWDVWNTIRTMCGYSNRLSAAIEIPRQLPPKSLQDRWFSEPARFLSFPRTTFVRNQKGFPVLSRPHQQYLTRFLRLRFPPALLLSDVGPIPLGDPNPSQSTLDPTPAEAAQEEPPEDPIPHLRYIRHLQQTQPSRPPIELFGQGYLDFLQSPLQPLTDNLESITYEVFEKDPIKYEWYEKAVALALKDLRQKLGDQRPIVVAVVGAGRGPLVTRVLLASRQTGIPVRCWAVEKNLNAHVLIQKRNATDPLWNKEVTVVKSDMRSWKGPVLGKDTVKVDIFVSELLGSFADNELSPECLDGAQHLLHPDHGISIPQSYTAHLTPIAAPKLYADILGRASTDLNLSTVDKWEIPYVVMLYQYDNLSLQSAAHEDSTPDVKKVWEFSHPAPDSILQQAQTRAGGSVGGGGFTGGDGSNEHNVRSSKLTFACPNRGVCHGLGGYFETVLYASTTTSQKVELSTNPISMEAKSKDMISWFPIFFPLQTPLFVPDKAELDINMWRQTDDRKVWYEWIVEVFERDARGKRKCTAMSGLHSSRKSGCMM